MSVTRPLVVTVGEALVDFIAEGSGSVGEAAVFRKSPGGAVANVAVALARLGLGSRFVTKLGLDPFGRFMKKFLESEGVDTSRIVLTDRFPTGVVFVALDEDRVPSFTFYGYPSADMMLDESEVGAETLEGAAFLHAGTVSMVTAENRDATFKLIGLAKDAGVRFSFDPNFRLHLWKDHAALKDLAWKAAEEAALIKLNLDELEFMTGVKDLEAGAQKLMETGADAVVVTLGPEGAYYRCADGEGEAPAFAAEVVDTTGAGDGFAAGLIASLAELGHWPPKARELVRAARFASAVAARVVTGVGAVASLPRREEVEAMLGDIQEALG